MRHVNKTIFAIGGTEIGPVQPDGKTKPNPLEHVHREIINSAPTASPHILYIPTAKDDREDYIAGFRYYYGTLGCQTIDVLKLLDKSTSKAEAKRKIEGADIIYVNGGNTKRMIAWWKRYGVDSLLRAAYDRGAIMAGHSAGAICWFEYGCSDSFYKKQPFCVSALGIFPAVLCPHYDTEPVRQQALKKMMKRLPSKVAITLDEESALKIVNDQYVVLSGGQDAKMRLAYWDHGEYRVIQPPRKGKAEPLLRHP